MRTAAESLTVLRPRSLREALAMLRDASDGSKPLVPLAGGTDLYVGLNAGTARETRYIDLWPLDKLRGIAKRGVAGDVTLVFGALTTYSACIASAKVNQHLPILAAASREVGGVQIQNRGTLGGNIGNGSPAGDALPELAAAETTQILRSVDGQRAVPLGDFYTGYRATVRRDDELITEIHVTVPRGVQRFRKVGTRAAQAISKVVLAAIGPRVALGSVAATVVRARALEAYLALGGRDPGELRRLLGEGISPIGDVRSTAEYRRRVAENVVVDWFGGRSGGRRA